MDSINFKWVKNNVFFVNQGQLQHNQAQNGSLTALDAVNKKIFIFQDLYLNLNNVCYINIYYVIIHFFLYY